MAPEQKKPPIIYVSGSVGGVGKSMVSMIMIDYIQHVLKQPVRLIESDDSNPNVLRAYRTEVDEYDPLNLDEADGWIELFNLAEETSHWMVVNGGARNSAGLRKYGAPFVAEVGRIGRVFQTAWVIGVDRDCVEALADFVDLVAITKSTPVDVVANAGRSADTEFPEYETSEISATVAGHGGRMLYLPHLALRVADKMRNSRLTIADAMRKLPFGHRLALERWRREVHDVMRVLAGA